MSERVSLASSFTNGSMRTKLNRKTKKGKKESLKEIKQSSLHISEFACNKQCQELLNGFRFRNKRRGVMAMWEGHFIRSPANRHCVCMQAIDFAYC